MSLCLPSSSSSSSLSFYPNSFLPLCLPLQGEAGSQHPHSPRLCFILGEATPNEPTFLLPSAPSRPREPIICSSKPQCPSSFLYSISGFGAWIQLMLLEGDAGFAAGIMRARLGCVGLALAGQRLVLLSRPHLLVLPAQPRAASLCQP